jgi:NADH dehydrogenase (ubiquinone) 1 alpha subcomplex subunit 5
METKLGGGLLEEVIQVAEGEHKLVNKMIEARV